MLLGKQHNLIIRLKKCTRQASSQKSKSSYPMSPPIPWPHPLAFILSVNLYAHIASQQATIFHACSPNPFPATPLQPLSPQPSAQPSSLIPSGFFSPPISSHSLAPTRSAAVRTAKLAHPQRLLPAHFHPLPCTHAVRSRPHSQARAASSPHPFPATSAPTPSAAVRAAKLAHPQRLLLPIRFQPLLTFSFLSLPFSSFPFLSLFLSLSFPCSHTVRTAPFKSARSPTRLNN